MQTLETWRARLAYSIAGAGIVVAGIIGGAACIPDTNTPEAPVVSEYPTYQLPACAEEDSDNCYWDASVRGNGQGTSFVSLNGVVYYPR